MKIKNLENTINGMPKDEIVYVGCASSFIFIGTKEQWKKDCSGLNKNYKKHFEDSLSKLKERYNSSLESFKNVIFGHYNIDCFPYIETLHELGTSIKEYEEYVECWVDIDKRPVRDVHPRMSKDGTVIIIDGKESGNYWFKEEYDNKCPRKKV